MAIIRCPECGHEVSDRAKTCPHCGVGIAGELATCPDCGEYILKDQPFCPNCHCTINGAGETPQQPVTPRPAPLMDNEAAEQKAAEPKKKSNALKGLLVVAFVIALIVVLLGLYFYQRTEAQNEHRAYNNAMTSGEPAVLQNFLDLYTDAPKAHRDSIGIRLNELKKIDLEWAHAIATKNRAELDRYVHNHPGNVHVTEAQLVIDSLDFVSARTLATPEALRIYLEEHSDGSYYEEALRMKEQIEEHLRHVADSLRADSLRRDTLKN